MLQVIQGHSLDEIGAMFDLPRNTVATRLDRARRKLRAMLEGSVETGVTLKKPKNNE